MNPQGVDGKLHFYGDNPDVKPERRIKRFANESKHYDIAAEVLKDDKNRFTFCSEGINPWPFMNKFPTIKHTESIEHIKQWNTNVVNA